MARYLVIVESPTKVKTIKKGVGVSIKLRGDAQSYENQWATINPLEYKSCSHSQTLR